MKVVPKVFMIGAFPPPVHGMAAVNAAVKNEFLKAGVKPTVVNLSASSLSRSLMTRLGRLHRVAYGVSILSIMRHLRGTAFYMSVSGGYGQIYEILLVLVARVRGMRIFLHHHSFAYLDRYTFLTKMLALVAGSDAVHITQSPRMAQKLFEIYDVAHVVAISNAVFLLDERILHSDPRQQLHTLGFISNIAVEKGVFEFLDLLALADDRGLSINGKLAGPFQDMATARLVRNQLQKLSNVEYVGPKYGADKDSFFDEIDVFVFPSLYVNETEGIVNHEAMSRGIPVIAYGRGAIPEVVGADCGRVIDPSEPFAPEALKQLETWLCDSDAYKAASLAAGGRFVDTYTESLERWQSLLGEMLGRQGDRLCDNLSSEES